MARRMAADEGLQFIEAEMFPPPTQRRFRETASSLRHDPNARAVVVRCCPNPVDQRDWENLIGATETKVLDVDPEVCARRIKERGRSKWRAEVKAARQWRDKRLLPTVNGVVSREW